MTVCGVDYGRKLAGTTVIGTLAVASGDVQFVGSAKGRDADAFLMEWLTNIRPAYVLLDAPLSLPGVYAHPDQYTDYFFRAGDRELRAMSPMFLGALTARAMKLKAELATHGIPVYETYPAAQARRMQLPEAGYKQSVAEIPAVIRRILAQYLFFRLNIPEIRTWHHVDALLALISAYRFYTNAHATYGDAAEGVIMV